MGTKEALVELARYLLNKVQLNYVLLGACQSDKLESRFGWFRQMSGGNYWISLKQVLDSERKCKVVALLSHSNVSADDLRKISPTTAEVGGCTDELVDAYRGLAEEFVFNETDRSIVYYVSGSRVSSLIRKNSCIECTTILTADSTSPDAVLVEQRSRKSLCHPSEFVFLVAMQCYSVFTRVFSCAETKRLFLSQGNHFSAFLQLVDGELREEEDVIVGKSEC